MQSITEILNDNIDKVINLQKEKSEKTSSLQEGSLRIVDGFFEQKNLTKRVTFTEAKQYVRLDEDIPSRKCAFCEKILQPVGLLVNFLGKWKWMYKGEYEDCDCEGAKEYREQLRIQEEKRLATERERAYKEKIERMIRESKLGERFWNRTFENFIVNDENRAAYEMAKKYADEFEKYKNEGKGLIFIGSYGTGKTHLAAAICHALIKQDYQPIFGTMINLLEKIKVTYYDEFAKEHEDRVIERYTNCHLLIIDDLGKERPTEWAIEKLYYIVNTRYERCLPIVITTNYNIDKLISRLTIKDNTETAEAIVSRIYEMCSGIKMDWEDYRKL